MASNALDVVRKVFSGHKRRSAGKLAPRADLIFRLRAWPRLPENGRTAEVYRMLSVMSSQPVNRQWLLGRFELGPRQLDALLHQLVAQGSVEVIDPARFARG
ncbi:hypothetical protein [Ramlibacter sp. AN1133]|uniref:hypothetical protein n=1 Tax=Ramlibacter sp. AN1133 TaxID=3133429 RepID=UPI0030C5B5CA